MSILTQHNVTLPNKEVLDQIQQTLFHQIFWKVLVQLEKINERAARRHVHFKLPANDNIKCYKENMFFLEPSERAEFLSHTSPDTLDLQFQDSFNTQYFLLCWLCCVSGGSVDCIPSSESKLWF